MFLFFHNYFVYFLCGGRWAHQKWHSIQSKIIPWFLVGWWFKFTNYFSRNLEVFARFDKGLFTLYVTTKHSSPPLTTDLKIPKHPEFWPKCDQNDKEKLYTTTHPPANPRFIHRLLGGCMPRASNSFITRRWLLHLQFFVSQMPSFKVKSQGTGRKRCYFWCRCNIWRLVSPAKGKQMIIVPDFSTQESNPTIQILDR